MAGASILLLSVLLGQEGQKWCSFTSFEAEALKEGTLSLTLGLLNAIVSKRHVWVEARRRDLAAILFSLLSLFCLLGKTVPCCSATFL